METKSKKSKKKEEKSAVLAAVTEFNLIFVPLLKVKGTVSCQLPPGTM